ncbi:MAG: enoyl-CoA hydratase, partial [Thermoleophilaceae bacterium]|nr:enoyl-CoA hydratase [Thermoleophilaceae bacterium]
MNTLRYEVDGRVARITLARPERGNGITMDMTRELTEAVEQANLDREVHVIALSGNGKGFCGGYDLVEFAESQPPNHDPSVPWDPMLDYQHMSRNVRGFMSLFHSEKPVVCKVHGFCVAGGTDMALCSDLLVIADDARIGYPPARVWGVPTTALWAARVGDQRAKRLLFTGDSLSGAEAQEWGLA